MVASWCYYYIILFLITCTSTTTTSILVQVPCNIATLITEPHLPGYTCTSNITSTSNNNTCNHEDSVQVRLSSLLVCVRDNTSSSSTSTSTWREKPLFLPGQWHRGNFILDTERLLFLLKNLDDDSIQQQIPTQDLQQQLEHLKETNVQISSRDLLNNKEDNDVLNDLSKNVLKNKASKELSNDIDVDEKVQKATPRKHWIDLSHDIDVNYDENGTFVPDGKAADVGRQIEVIGMMKKKDGGNTWDGFKITSEKTTETWIDLSHDIDINYPKPGSGVVLDVEGEDVIKNINEPIRDVEELEEHKVEAEIEVGLPENSTPVETFDQPSRKRREITPFTTPKNANEDKVIVDKPESEIKKSVPLRIEALRVDEADWEPQLKENGVPELMANSHVVLRLFGTGFTEDTHIAFTHQQNEYGGNCLFPATESFQLEKESIVHNTAIVNIKLPPSLSTDPIFYICAKRTSLTEDLPDIAGLAPFVHQGHDSWLQLRSYEKLLPLWVSLLIIGVCLTFSALFSGLNLGLMSLDRTELKILCNTGTEKEKAYAKVIQPVRDHGNFLLCSILLGNVAVNSTFTILLDSLTSGVFAVVFSTLSIVLLGEITPQAICSRHGLAVGAKTIHVTKAVMALTFPLSYPVSKLLDFLLGEEIGNVYNRERLKELVKVTTDINDLDKDEVNIISGALEMRKKTVQDVMTKIEDVFMLDYEAVLDFETVSEIMKSGYSRIPVYENDRTNITAMLYIKDLAFVDPDDNTPLKTLCQFYQNPCNFVFEDVTLDIIFKQFKEGHKGHMAFVQRVNNEGEGDPFYETIGLVTLEDVIEELIQAEIVDETDVFTDNKTKRRRNRPAYKLQDFTVFAERRENQRIRISPQLTLATFQYLSTAVDAFKPDVVSEVTLRRLLRQDIIHHIKFRSKERQKNDPTTLIYEQGKPVDYFVLILEGRVEVTVGKENLVFESGPFTYFGSQSLMQNVGIAESSPAVSPSALGSLQSINMDSMLNYTFIPDYSVRAVTEVFYISIKRSLYLAAKRATLMEKCTGPTSKGDGSGEQFDDEVEKLLHSLEEDGSPIEHAKSPSHNLGSNRVSPVGLNGSLRMSRHQSPVKSPLPAAPLATAETTPVECNNVAPPTEASSLLPPS